MVTSCPRHRLDSAQAPASSSYVLSEIPRTVKALSHMVSNCMQTPLCFLKADFNSIILTALNPCGLRDGLSWHATTCGDPAKCYVFLFIVKGIRQNPPLTTFPALFTQ